jgi:hypothetical protein
MGGGGGVANAYKEGAEKFKTEFRELMEKEG